MTAWLTLARHALRLYPLAYQRRYGEEMRALLEDQPPRPSTLLDLLRGALLAHLRPADAPAGVVGPADRMRASASGVLMCWVFFAAAGFAYYKTTEDQPFSAAGRLHPLLTDAHVAVQVVAALASATVVLGALPLIWSALAHAGREPGVRRTVALPFLPVAAFGFLTAVVVALAHTQPANHTSNVGGAVAVAWGIIGLACGAGCVRTCRAALFAVRIPPARLLAALACGTLVTAGMLVVAAVTAIYAVALNLDASGLAATSNGPFGILSTSASLIVQVVVMAAAGAVATVTTRRGWRALQAG